MEFNNIKFSRFLRKTIFVCDNKNHFILKILSMKNDFQSQNKFILIKKNSQF